MTMRRAFCVLTACLALSGASVSAVANPTGGSGLLVSSPSGVEEAEQVRIIGGVNATETYSFIGSLPNFGVSLIAPSFVITASHCHDKSGTQQIRFASIKADEGGETRKVKRWIRHPKASDYANDIMIGQLDSPAPAGVSPIALATKAPEFGVPTRILGWGQIENKPGGARATSLQQMDTSLVAPEKCKPAGSWPSFNASNELCTNNPEGKGPCLFDSGGPQITKVGETWALIGVVNRSSGAGCGERPSIFASVPAHLEWINKVITPVD